MKIVHITSVHSRYDTRIFVKQCRSLAAEGHDVTLVVADDKRDELLNGIAIRSVGAPGRRLRRMAFITWRAVQVGLELDADLYHLHDPELLPAALWLKRRQKRVIFDAHEDLPKQILSKPYLPAIFRRTIAFGAGLLQRLICRRLDAVVAATPTIKAHLATIGTPCVDINNFPLLDELPSSARRSAGIDDRNVCYVGSITAARGIVELVSALSICRSGAQLLLAGNFSPAHLREEVVRLSGWSHVSELGFLTRVSVGEILARSSVGVVTLHATPAYVDALPVKMFEYMSAGLPVIASDFPLWREIVEGNGCGICVDPCDPSAIAQAIDRLIDDRQLAHEMGENGRNAVRRHFNWESEKQKLLRLYQSLCDQSNIDR